MTLSRSVFIVEGSDEKAAFKAIIRYGDIASSEILVAIRPSLGCSCNPCTYTYDKKPFINPKCTKGNELRNVEEEGSVIKE